MIIRKATTEDIPAIVQLLKASLGDVSSRKSVEYWNWKHVNNPFGPSPVLVAEQDGQLIGVRAFMRWDWQAGGKVYKALRAVDTATHPDYQGKGIFKKLTMQLVESAIDEGYDFIFNSPNTQSTPGYLKMGWEVWGRMPVWIGIGSLFGTYRASVFQTYHDQLMQSDLSQIAVNQRLANGLTTLVSVDWLRWRYQLCPVKGYGLKVVTNNSNRVSLFFTVKHQRIGTELRICQFFFEGNFDVALLVQASRSLAKELGCRLISVTGLEDVAKFRLLLSGFFALRRVGVTLTLRKLGNAVVYNQLMEKRSWCPETAAIELF